MLIGYFKEYKGYTGTIEYDPEDNISYGKLLNIKDLVNYQSLYESKNILDLYRQFQEAVDDYLELKNELNNKK